MSQFCEELQTKYICLGSAVVDAKNNDEECIKIKWSAEKRRLWHKWGLNKFPKLYDKVIA